MAKAPFRRIDRGLQAGIPDSKPFGDGAGAWELIRQKYFSTKFARILT
jgi:hypothetical protein